jgi:phosphate acetyltransferase
MQSIDPTKVIESEIFDEFDVGDTITVSVGVPAKDGLRRQITFVCSGIDQRVGEVIEGMAMDMASAENTKPSPVDVPEQHLREHEIFFRTILERTRGLEPLRIAVVHPVDRNALLGAVEAAQAELILPTFVGPEDRIRATAQAEQIDISPYALVSTEHSHAAAARSVAMARSGEVDALMKGSLHTDELMHEVVAPDTGLTTDRRMSHVFVLDVPTYPRPLFITDAALNVDPDLDAKRGYCPERENTLVVVPCGRRKIWDAQPWLGGVPAPRTFSSRCAGLSVPTMVVCISGCEIV